MTHVFNHPHDGATVYNFARSRRRQLVLSLVTLLRVQVYLGTDTTWYAASADAITSHCHSQSGMSVACINIESIFSERKEKNLLFYPHIYVETKEHTFASSHYVQSSLLDEKELNLVIFLLSEMSLRNETILTTCCIDKQYSLYLSSITSCVTTHLYINILNNL